MREYDLIAEWYASERTGSIGVPEVESLAAALPPGSRVLDVGCGNGVPLTHALLRAGHRVVGLDSSREMLARFRRNWPKTPIIHGVAQACPFADGVFDAAVSWGVFFHHDRDDQIRAYSSVARVLKPGALFLFTATYEYHAEGIVGTMNGVTFPYFSPFSLEEFTHLLRENGLTVLDRHTDSGDNSYFLTKKSA